jgi:hypothetical protein
MATLRDLFKEMSENYELAKTFTEDTNAVLTDHGIDPSELTIVSIPGDNAPFSQFQEAIQKLETDSGWRRSASVCASIG